MPQMNIHQDRILRVSLEQNNSLKTCLRHDPDKLPVIFIILPSLIKCQNMVMVIKKNMAVFPQLG